MVDRAYKGAIPAFMTALEELRDEFSRIHSRTDWTRLRVEPLLKHVASLEVILKSRRFAREISRLRSGTPMFHSDLVYLRQNVKELERALLREKKASGRNS
jgi:hypothetical protein